MRDTRDLFTLHYVERLLDRGDEEIVKPLEAGGWGRVRDLALRLFGGGKNEREMLPCICAGIGQELGMPEADVMSLPLPGLIETLRGMLLDRGIHEEITSESIARDQALATEQRRFKQWYMSESCIRWYLKKVDQWPEVIAFSNIKGPPEDACLVDVELDAEWPVANEKLRATFAHVTFDPVEVGAKIPVESELGMSPTVRFRRGVDGLFRELKAGGKEIIPPKLDDIRDHFKLMDDSWLDSVEEAIKEIKYDREVGP